MLTGPEECVEEFRKGYNCSQALLATYSKDVGMDKELLGCDISTAEGMERATKESLFPGVCFFKTKTRGACAERT